MRTPLKLTILALLIVFFNQVDCIARSDKTCAFLYSVDNFKGDTFNVTDGVYFSNLEEAYVTSDSVWNVTGSVKVESGCMFTACSESYFDGRCRKFEKEFVRLPPGFDNILSLNCTCSKVHEILSSQICGFELYINWIEIKCVTRYQ
jgi:hypothetical protein